MPVGPNGEPLPYPGDPGFVPEMAPGMGGGPGPDIPPMDAGMGMGMGPDIPPPMPPMPPPDLAAGAAPGMRDAIVGRLEEIESEKAQLVAALQEMDQEMGMPQDGPAGEPVMAPPPGLLA